MDIWSFIKDNIGTIKDLATLITSLAVAYVAIQGLKTWKTQLVGNTEYEHARKLLRSVYKVRDAINGVRSPLITGGETSSAIKELGLEVGDADPNGKEFTKKTRDAVYDVRWKRIAEAMTEFDLESIEAEALWGNSVADKLTPIWKGVGELNRAVSELLTDNLTTLPKDLLQEVRDVLYSPKSVTDPESPSTYSKKIALAIKAIEEYLKPKLKL
jgi:hypothetical protein